MNRLGARMRPRSVKFASAPASGPSIDADLVRQLARLLGESDLAEMEIEKGDLRIKLVRHHGPAHTIAAPAAQPFVIHTPAAGSVAAAAPAPAAAAASAAAEEQAGLLKSPMVGTVYRRPNPEAKAFVDVGMSVKAGDRVLLVEAMKTFNDIVAPRSGIVTSILVEDGQPVEYGQPLLVIE